MIMRAHTSFAAVCFADLWSTTRDVMVGTIHGADIGAM